jgi:uncharacterized protein (DUF433 family)
MPRELAPGITADPGIQGGRPVIQGRRVPVELVLGQLGGGMSIEQVMDEYDLRRDDILAALRYAAKLVAAEESKAIS